MASGMVIFSAEAGVRGDMVPKEGAREGYIYIYILYLIYIEEIN